METLEERDSTYIQEQIDVFQNHYMNKEVNVNNNDNNNNEPMVPCPLCHTGNLIKDATTGIIYCQRYQGTTGTTNTIEINQRRTCCCKVYLNGVNANRTSLDELRNTLSHVHQEHAESCMGVLQFDVVDNHLLLGCNECGARATVI